MKKRLYFIFAIAILGLLSGCNYQGEKNIIKQYDNKISKLSSYLIKGELEIYNNEDSYKYLIESAYKKDGYFKVILRNKLNNHEQIILKNDDGVFVMTPNLNKSYKFQTDWPFNTSQIYILQSVLNDLNKKDGRIFKKNENDNIFIVRGCYSDSSIESEEITIDKDLNIKEVRVLDKEGQLKMNMKFTKNDYNYNFSDDYFMVKTSKEIIPTNKTLNSIIYPMFLPLNTQLSGQEKIGLNNGERVILTFSGDKPFIMVQETISSNKEMITIPTIGNPQIISDSVGIISDNSVNWISNGVEFYISSEKLNSNELLEVANSINTKSVAK